MDQNQTESLFKSNKQKLSECSSNYDDINGMHSLNFFFF